RHTRSKRDWSSDVCSSDLIILVSDYDKGVCTPGLLSAIISAACAKGIRVIADPIRGHDYRKYHGCSAITPNRLEAGLATSRVLKIGRASCREREAASGGPG